ncbi:hypothetical protein H2204_011707 [Knufia peltigerae]|uniref:Uncharacterized protein n=1 Tax=Knufia peltigerae TaxID=1002370 RepID=A0AA39CSZ9_9EURO|nr:hypothetical protein H2204_011707 [Knufia peltigerae]
MTSFINNSLAGSEAFQRYITPGRDGTKPKKPGGLDTYIQKVASISHQTERKQYDTTIRHTPDHPDLPKNTTVKGDGKIVNVNRRRAALKGKPVIKGLDLDAIIKKNNLNCSKRTLRRTLRERVIRDPTAKDRIEALWSKDQGAALQALGLLPSK